MNSLKEMQMVFKFRKSYTPSFMMQVQTNTFSSIRLLKTTKFDMYCGGQGYRETGTLLSHCQECAISIEAGMYLLTKYFILKIILKLQSHKMIYIQRFYIKKLKFHVYWTVSVNHGTSLSQIMKLHKTRMKWLSMYRDKRATKIKSQ